jgi:hypothetical protein
VNRSIINHGLVSNVQNWLMKERLQDPSEVHEDDLSNVNQEGRLFRNKKIIFVRQN